MVCCAPVNGPELIPEVLTPPSAVISMRLPLTQGSERYSGGKRKLFGRRTARRCRSLLAALRNP